MGEGCQSDCQTLNEWYQFTHSRPEWPVIEPNVCDRCHRNDGQSGKDVRNAEVKEEDVSD